MRRGVPEDISSAGGGARAGRRGLGLDVEYLAAAVEAGLWVHAMAAIERAINRILGEFGSDESVGGATIGATAFGLFAFRISHVRGELGVRGRRLSEPDDVVKGSYLRRRVLRVKRTYWRKPPASSTVSSAATPKRYQAKALSP